MAKAIVTITLTVTVLVPDTWPEDALAERIGPYLDIAVSGTSPKLKVASHVVFNVDDVELTT